MNFNFLCIPVLILAGVVLQKVHGSRKVTEFLLIFLTFPALMLTEAMRLELKLASVSLFSLVYLLACFTWSWLTSRGMPERQAKTVVFNSTFFNSMFLPFPIIQMFYGDLSPALLFSVPVMIIHNTIGLLYLSAGRAKEGLKKVITFPPLLAFLLGLILRPFAWYGKSFELLHEFGKLTVYLSLVVVGLYLPFSSSIRFFSNRVSMRIFLNRMVFSPLFVLAFLPLFSDRLVQRTLVITSLMAPAITNVVIISSFDLDTESTSQSLFLPTFISLAVVFSLRWLGAL